MALVLAIPIWVGLNVVCYAAFCLALGPWGGALDGTDASDMPGYVPWLSRLLFGVLIAGSLLLGWRLAPRCGRKHDDSESTEAVDR